MIQQSPKEVQEQLPGLDCGACGSRTCEKFAALVAEKPELLERCIHLSQNKAGILQDTKCQPLVCKGCQNSATDAEVTWHDSLGREFDFILDALPGDPGRREVILPHNPFRTAQLYV